MKKTFFFTLTLVLTLGLVSCGSKESNDKSSNEENKPAAEEKTEETTSQGSLEYDESYAHSGVEFMYNGLHYVIINHNSVYLDRHESHQSLSGELVIPSKVRYNNATYYVVGIGDEAFEKCTGLTSVTIPNSVKVIEDGAFEFCYSLSSITLADGITNLDASAFDNTHYYNNEENWENGVLYIGKYLVATREISHCSIKEGTKYIASYAFSRNKMLRSITIPNSVTSIGKRAFRSCENLTSVTISNSVTEIGWEAFAGCNVSHPIHNAHSIFYIPEFIDRYVIPEGIKLIGLGAFLNCSRLTFVSIPNSVKEIGVQAFDGCSSLTSITIPKSVEEIGSDAFVDCSKLTSASVSSHTKIAEDAFPEHTQVIRY